MNTNFLVRMRHYAGLIIGWWLGLSFLMTAIILIFDEKSNYIGVICFFATAALLLPPVWSKLKIKMRWYNQLSLKIVGSFVLFLLGMSLDPAFDQSAQQSSLSTNTSQAIVSIGAQDNLYNKIIYQKIYKTLNGEETGLDQHAWMQVMGITGTANASSILREFEENEVAAAKKYDSGWIISGRIYNIDDGLFSATVGLDGSEYFNLGAKIDDKELAATYNKGQRVKLYCESILETVTLVFANDCYDYGVWFNEAVTEAEKNMYKNNDSFKEKSNHYKRIISDLPTDHACYDDFQTENCQKLF